MRELSANYLIMHIGDQDDLHREDRVVVQDVVGDVEEKIVFGWARRIQVEASRFFTKDERIPTLDIQSWQ